MFFSGGARVDRQSDIAHRPDSVDLFRETADSATLVASPIAMVSESPPR